MTTVNEIMEQYSTSESITRNVAKDAIEALRALASFTETLWTNSFCHGRYTSPSGKWTATDETGSVEISWSVNAATGADNGYSISRSSWWTGALVARAVGAIASSEATAGHLREEATRERKLADAEGASAANFLLSAHRRLVSAANARRVGERANAAHWMEFAAQDRRSAARALANQQRHLSRSRHSEARHADQLWVIGQINARIIAGGAMLRDWSAPLDLASLGAFPGCTRDEIPGGALEPVQTWERELLMQSA